MLIKIIKEMFLPYIDKNGHFYVILFQHQEKNTEIYKILIQIFKISAKSINKNGREVTLPANKYQNLYIQHILHGFHLFLLDNMYNYI